MLPVLVWSVSLLLHTITIIIIITITVQNPYIEYTRTFLMIIYVHYI